MAKHLSPYEKLMSTYFIPDHILAVLFGQNCFDAVETDDENGHPKQAMANIPQTTQDCEDMKEFVTWFGAKPEHIYMLDNPTAKEASKIYMMINKMLKAGQDSVPQVNYVVWHVHMGHGVQHLGT